MSCSARSGSKRSRGRHADQVLEDKQIVAAVYEALGKRHPKSRSRGQPATPAEVVLRLLVLKHMRNWSYDAFAKAALGPLRLNHASASRVWARRRPDATAHG